MKYLFVFFSSLILNTAEASDTTFYIKGKLDKVRTGKIYLSYYYNDKSVKDSATLSDGKFAFRGVVSEAVSAALTYNDSRNDYFSFYLEPTDIKISGAGDSLKLLSIKGSLVNEDNAKLKEMMKQVNLWEEKNSKIYDLAFKEKNKAVMDSLDEVDLEIMLDKRKVVTEFVRANPKSVRGAMAIRENYAYYAEATEMEPAYNLLSESIKQSKLGKSLNKTLETYRTVAIGKVAPDISQTTPAGTTLALSSTRGNYVLVDFWASWCGPCRRENPNVVNIFNTYKDKGFSIFGVSYDTKKDRWEKAIKDDGLIWQQVSDLQGWKNSTSELYGIKAIPSNMILEKNGVIVAKNLFGKKLAAKMQELYQ